MKISMDGLQFGLYIAKENLSQISWYSLSLNSVQLITTKKEW